MTSPTAYRLSTNVLPERYQITLTPDLEAFTFEGHETVTVSVSAPTAVIEMNAAELTVHSASVTLADGSSLNATVEVDEAAEWLKLAFPQQLPTGEAQLRLSFTGTLNDQMRGFYRSRYTAADGSTKYMATTQFEATDARRAFPCWDEPSVKAVFEMTLVIPEGLTAISNMPEAANGPAPDGRRAVRLQPSPRMSTYLVAFVVGDMACVQGTADNRTLVRVWATRGNEEKGRFALENSIKILHYMNGYFGIDYPLPKMDHIAIPDFAAGAMENWGAITYRETALLFDPQNSAAQARQRILEVVAHEMAHMWFGDLVTMEWWDDLWLNESFASWMGDKAVDHLYPEWEMWTQFVSQDTNSALSLDGLRNSHPIEVEVKDPAEIRELFDAISYSKGGSVLRMIEDFLGAETFRQGLHRYLASHSYGNARTEHLWHALAETSNKPVTTIMDSWVKQTGYPVLTADVRREGASSTISLTQKRFLYDNLLDTASADGVMWQVPVTIAQGGADRKTSFLMADRSASVALPSADTWTKVNAGQTAFFRVNYPLDEWERLKQAVLDLDLPSTDRLGLQNDAYALVRAGYLSATAFLSLAEAYVSETDAPVWGDLAANLRGLEGLLIDAPFIDQYREFARGLFDKIVQKVGWDARPGEGHLDALLRSTVIGQHGAYGGRSTLAEAQRRFDKYLQDPASLHPDLRGVTLGLVAQQGARDAYDTLWRLEKQATLHEEKVRILGALTRFQDQSLLRDLLSKSLSEDIRSQDAPLVIVSTAGNSKGRDLTWDFIKDNWTELDRRYGKGGFAIMRLVSITGGFTTLEREQEVGDFFQSHPAPSAARTIQQSLERIRLNAKWLERNRDEVGGWLAAHTSARPA